MKKDIFINDCAYTISSSDYFKLESIQEEMQELVNQNRFKDEKYNDLLKLFSTFLKFGVEKDRVKNNEINSDVFYYTY